MADLAASSEATPTSQNNPTVAESESAKVGDVVLKLPPGQLVLTGPKWAGAEGFQRVSNKEAEARLAGYTVVYANGNREYQPPDGGTKIGRKNRNSYSYGDWPSARLTSSPIATDVGRNAGATFFKRLPRKNSGPSGRRAAASTASPASLRASICDDVHGLRCVEPR